jgi:hypothetical protein
LSGAPVTGIPVGSLGDKDFYAKWETVQYTISFDANGGSPTPQTRTVSNGASVGAVNMPAKPENSNPALAFDGWYTKPDGGELFTGDTTVKEDITVYAKWVSMYTVTFKAPGGDPATQTVTVEPGAPVGAANMPNIPTRINCLFAGWYMEDGSEFTADTPVTEDNIMVRARWSADPGLKLVPFLEWVKEHRVDGDDYIYTLIDKETIEPYLLSYNGENVRITLSGGTVERTVNLSSPGSLFTVGNNVTLVLEEKNITLEGRSDNTVPLVRVNSGGALEMKTGSKVSDNTNISDLSGGGVRVDGGGTFTMSDGEISGNTDSFGGRGGGVYVTNGEFTMSGGEISNNIIPSQVGGGVYVEGSKFTMSGGYISDNKARSAGGVCMSEGTFTMKGGEISGNSCTSTGGGGMWVISNGKFIMKDEEISGNQTTNNPFYFGGGVGINDTGTFEMSGGYISGNEAYEAGGGVYLESASFTMNGGKSAAIPATAG